MDNKSFDIAVNLCESCIDNLTGINRLKAAEKKEIIQGVRSSIDEIIDSIKVQDKPIKQACAYISIVRNLCYLNKWDKYVTGEAIKQSKIALELALSCLTDSQEDKKGSV